MKIDVVVGNPPYQKTYNCEEKVGCTIGESIYQLFVENGSMMSDIVCMITPTKWFAGNKKLDNMREILLTGNHVSGLVILDAMKTFNIKMDRVTYFCWNKNYTGKTRIIDFIDSSNNDIRYISFGMVDCFIPSKTDLGIVEKVIQGESIEPLVNSFGTFDISSKERPLPVKMNDDDVLLHYTGSECHGDNVGYIPRDQIKRNINYIDAHKVICTTAFDLINKNKIINRVIYIGKGEVCTISYLVIGPTETEQEARNIEKYIKTKFVRALVRVRVNCHSLNANRFRFVPMQDFTESSDIDWSKHVSDIDKQLYNKYRLSQEEIDYIERTIKPIE